MTRHDQQIYNNYPSPSHFREGEGVWDFHWTTVSQ